MVQSSMHRGHDLDSLKQCKQRYFSAQHILANRTYLPMHRLVKLDVQGDGFDKMILSK